MTSTQRCAWQSRCQVHFDARSCIIITAMTESLEEASVDTSNLTQLKSAHRSFFAHETISATGIRFNNTHIFVANIDGTIGVYDRETGQQRERLKGHTSGVATLQCTRQTLVSGSSDCTVRIWDLTTMKLRHTLRGHQATVRTMHILDSAPLRVKGELEPNYQVIVTGSGDSTIRVWRLPEEDANSQTSFEAAPTPSVLDVSAGHDSSTTNSTSDHFLLRTCQGHSAAITATVVDGGKCVSGSTDKTVRVWDIESGQCEHVFEGHTDRSEWARLRSTY
jgi:F-box and WD-40 domain protein CDC4